MIMVQKPFGKEKKIFYLYYIHRMTDQFTRECTQQLSPKQNRIDLVCCLKIFLKSSGILQCPTRFTRSDVKIIIYTGLACKNVKFLPPPSVPFHFSSIFITLSDSFREVGTQPDLTFSSFLFANSTLSRKLLNTSVAYVFHINRLFKITQIGATVIDMQLYKLYRR